MIVFSLLQCFLGKELYWQVDIENLVLMNLPHFLSICYIYMCTGCLGLFICDDGGLLSHSSNCSCCPCCRWMEGIWVCCSNWPKNALQRHKLSWSILLHWQLWKSCSQKLSSFCGQAMRWTQYVPSPEQLNLLLVHYCHIGLCLLYNTPKMAVHAGAGGGENFGCCL